MDNVPPQQHEAGRTGTGQNPPPQQSEASRTGTTQNEGNQNRLVREARCRICQLLFDSLSQLGQHFTEHHPEFPFLCFFCDQQYDNMILRNQHMIDAHQYNILD